MQPHKDLTDREALLKHRRRALRSPGPPEFVNERAVQEIRSRLHEIRREFETVSVVSGFPEIWGGYFPGAESVPDDETISLAEASFDLVIHAMALHWANDPVGQLIQCRRALVPDGLMVAALFGGDTLTELRVSIMEAEAALRGGISPRVAPMGDIRDLGGLLQRAGFALPVADRVKLNVSYQSMTALMHDLRVLGETNALASRQTVFSTRKLFDEAARIYTQRFSDGQGRVSATFELIFLTGWAPSSNQQQPLRPGSALMKLQDVLRTQSPDLN